MASLEGGSPANRSYYHSLARPSGSLVKVTLGGKFSLSQSTNVFSFDCTYKIQNYPPCHQFLTCLLVPPNPLYDKVRHLLIAQHIPKACVRIDEQARQFMIWHPRSEVYISPKINISARKSYTRILEFTRPPKHKEMD